MSKEKVEIELEATGDLKELERCTFVLLFSESPAGKLAWILHKKHVAELEGKNQKIKIGSTIALPPGMSLGVLLPNGETKVIGIPNRGEILSIVQKDIRDGGKTKEVIRNFINQEGHERN